MFSYKVNDDIELKLLEETQANELFALVDKNGNITSRIDDNGNPIIYYNGLEQGDINKLIEDIKKLL